MNFGVIAAGHPQTAQVGAQILQAGGNAVDAAVGAAFASFIAEATLVNIGGGGVAHIFDPTTGEAMAYDFFSTMPSGQLDPDRLDFRRIEIDFGSATQPFYIGRGSVAVPGVVAGLCRLVEEYGRLPLAEILAPVIELAAQGAQLSAMGASIGHLLEPILTDTSELGRIFTPSTGTQADFNIGDTIRFPHLATTLSKIAAQGATAFYHGEIADRIVADQQTHGGLLTAADLADYQVYRLPSIEVVYRDYKILLPPPSSTGGVLIAFALRLLASQSVGELTHNSPEHIRLLAEAMRLTNLSRPTWTKLSDGIQPPQASEAVAQYLASSHVTPYTEQLTQILAGASAPTEPLSPPGPSNTTHISVADADGMIVSVTTSAGESSGFLVADTGLLMNNMLGELDLHPNGFHQLPAGQRLATMMAPTLVLRAGQPVLAIGSGGSNRIRSAIVQVLSNILDFGLPLDDAVNASRVHFEDNVLQLEAGISETTAEQLAALGYQINMWDVKSMYFGGAHIVGVQDGRWQAAGDLRRGGVAQLV